MRRGVAFLFLFGNSSAALWAQNVAPSPHPLDLSFEELGEITVTTASKRAEPLFLTPAAVSVFESHDIARMGATTLMDVLRFAPGVQVAQINPTAWAIGVRGFNSQDSRKLLVMRDGRSVYDTLFSGVWWDVQDPLLDDVSRIEIVRGPGGALWGANAVNGVINIISKPARDTQGLLATTILQDDGHRLYGMRYGWKAGADTFARVSLQERQSGDMDLLTGAPGRNRHRLLTGSLRLDHGNPGVNGFSLHGNFHSGRSRQTLQLPVLSPPYTGTFSEDVTVSGINLHGRWDRTDPAYGTFTVQAYFDYFSRGPISLDQSNHTYDLDVQHTTPALGRHQIIWGAGYRQVEDALGSSTDNVQFDPPMKVRRLYNVFVQDEVTLVPDRWRWITGVKFERNDYSGWEIQPSTRMLFTPRTNLTLWAAFSRAVRTPDRTSDFLLRLATLPPPTNDPGAGPTEVLFRGDPSIKAEILQACEAGVRFEPMAGVRLDASLYWNDYDRLLNFVPGSRVPAIDPVRTISYIGAGNLAGGGTYGGELSAVWQVQPHWRLTANYSCLQMHLDGPGLPFLDNSNGQNPGTMLTLHSAHDLGANLSIDLLGRHVGRLPSWNVPAYTELDVQVTWRPRSPLAITLFGRNLLQHSHYEAPSGRTGNPSAIVARTIGLQVKLQY